MPVCVDCRQEFEPGQLMDSGRCRPCQAAHWRTLAAAFTAEFAGSSNPRLAAWWQSVSRQEYVVDNSNAGAGLVGSVVGGLLLGPVGAAVGAMAGGGEEKIVKHSASLGIICLDEEAVWILEGAGPTLGKSSRLEEAQIASMLSAWETRSLSPEVTRIPLNQVSCHAGADGLVLKYRRKTWSLQLCASRLVPDQPSLSTVLDAIKGGVEVPRVEEFMARMVSKGPPPDARLLDAVAADSSYMDQVLARLERLRRKNLKQFLAGAAGTSSGFRVLIRAWVMERAEGLERRARAAYVLLALAAAGALVLLFGAFSPGGIPGLAIAVTVIAAPLALGSWIKMRRTAWFQSQLAQFESAGNPPV